MDFTQFLNRDVRPVKATGWIDARNILLNKGFKSVSNENGFDLSISVVNGVTKDYLDMDIIGILCAGLDIVIFSTNNIYSEIGILNGNGTYVTKLRTTQTTYLGITYDLLAFSKNHPIRGVFRNNYNNELEIAFTDFNVTPKFLNLTNFPLATYPQGHPQEYELVEPNKFTLLELFPEMNTPNFNLLAVNKGGGSILVGALYFTIAYEIDYYNLTNWTSLSKPIIVGKEIYNTTTAPGYVQSLIQQFFSLGEDSASYTNSTPYASKSVSLNITGLDTRYNFYRLAIIHKAVNGVVTAFEVGRYNINQQNVTYTGNKLRDLSVEEVIVPTISYPKIKDFVGFNNELLALNCETRKEFNYQKYANNIKVRFGTEVIGADNYYPLLTMNYLHYSKPETIFNKGTFMPDEVYALNIVWVFKDGTHSDAFHIPGREAISITEQNITFNENDALDSLAAPVHISAQEQKLNTVPNQLKFFHTRNTADLTTGRLSFWENQDDYYLDTDDYLVYDGNTDTQIGDIRGQKVRHHRMPDCSVLYPNTTTISNSTVVSPNATFDILEKSIYLIIEDVFIPADMKSEVVGWYITYNEKNNTNSIVVGSGIVTPQDLLDTTNPPPTQSVRFYNFGLQTLKPALLNTYLKTCYGVKLLGYNTITMGTAGIQTYLFNNANGLINFKRNRYNNINVVESVKYYPSDNTATSPDNAQREDYIYIDTDLAGNVNFTFPTPIAGTFPRAFYIANLCNHFLNVHTLLSNEKVVSTGVIIDKNVTQNLQLYGGDTNFATQGSLKLQDPLVANAPSATIITTFVGFLYRAYARHNINFRAGKEYQPLTDLTINPHLGFNNLDSSFYSETFNSVLNIKTPSLYQPYNIFSNKLQFRIARSNNSGLESKINNWRTFLNNRYYEMPKNKGAIWCGAVSNKNLYIQMERSLFVSDIKDSLKTGTTDVYIATSDIFERLPNEIISLDNGYIGCRSMWGTCVTKYGYVVVDAEQGKVFLIGNDVQEISKNGMYQFFDTNLDLNSTVDNPFTQIGITVSYDDENDRLLLTKNRSGKGSLTIAYSFTNKGWTDFHDYTPNLLFFNKEGLFSVKNRPVRKEIYRHNSPVKYGMFYKDDITHTQQVFSSYIDIVFTWEKETVLEDIQWETEVLSNLGAVLYDKTATHIMIYNENQCSSIINLKDNRFINNRNKVKTWNFNEFRDIVKNKNLPFLDDEGNVINSNINNTTAWFKQNKFTGKFAIVRIIYDNSNQNRFYLNDIRVNIGLNEI